jgi:PAS domain S-box-containing protein
VRKDAHQEPGTPSGKIDLFRLLVERVKDYAIFSLDESGRVITWNIGAEHIKGYTADEIIGHHFSRFYPPEAIRAGWPQQELREARRLGRFEDEGWRIRKDGSKFWANVVITALFDDEGTLHGFAKITRDLTDRMRMERIEADSRQLGEFVAMLGHELRNPLAPIRTAVEVARQRPDDTSRTKMAIDVIDRQSAHLAQLVEDLLDVSRITRNQIKLNKQRVSINKAIALAVEAVQPMCDQRGHRLTVEMHSQLVVRGDPVRLTQVFANLLGNACKYTPRGGLIDLSVGRTGDAVVIVVSDNGGGIAPDLLPRVFDIFTQDERSLERSEGGLGVGLAIAKRLVEMHGGTIAAESAGPGCGATFTVQLPLLEEAAAIDGGNPSPGATVVVVDDNPDALETLQALLEISGHRVFGAIDGEGGLALARRHTPDVVLLDIGLPGMDGYEVARQIRGTERLDGVILVAITGYGTTDDKERAKEVGFDHHFAKPLDFRALQRAVPILASEAGPIASL